MSRTPARTTRREELLKRLSELGRKLSTQTVFLHQAIAQSAGLNATDTKCVDLILSHPEQRLTAGALSAMSGLSTGALTHVLDRLEKGRFIERVRDQNDRRKVYVRVRLESVKPLLPRYEEIGKAFTEVAATYAERDIKLICDYMETSGRVAERELKKLTSERASKL